MEKELFPVCPDCERPNFVKNGRDRRGAQVFRCADCRHSFTVLTGTPFSGHSFPPAVIGLAMRWYLRFRLSYADVLKWLAERSIQVDASTVFDGVQKFAPLYQDAACGGNPWTSTFLDTSRYLEEHARLAQQGVRVIVHNTLATSDYGLLEENTFAPRPNYWAHYCGTS